MRTIVPVCLAIVFLTAAMVAAHAQDETEVLPGLTPPSVSSNANNDDMLEAKQKSAAPASTATAAPQIAKPKDVHSVIVQAYEGNRVAQYELGVLLLNGVGVAKDEKKAATWFLRAANQGVPEAQWETAQLQLQGIAQGGKSSTYKWMLLSEGKNPERIAARKKVEQDIPPELAAIIQKQAATWQPTIEPFKAYGSK